MQCGIDQLYIWLNINKLSLNIDKNNILLFNIRDINDNVKLKLKIDNKEIRNVEMINVWVLLLTINYNGIDKYIMYAQSYQDLLLF